MNVLIGVDDSSESRDAVDTAFEFFGVDAVYTVASVASRSGTPVGPVFAATYPPRTYTAAIELANDFATAEAEAAVAQASAELPGARVAVETGVGSVGRQLCRIAESERIDVVVIGSKDKNVWQRLLDPSVGRHLIDNAPCPVLVVR